MAQLFVCDSGGLITVDLEAAGPVLGEALDHEQAGALVRCAMLMALSALAEGGVWPTAALECMSAFMTSMKDEVYSGRLM